MGFGPQLVDLDSYGNVDLISGSWPGEIFFFARQPDGSFEKPEMLKDKSGEFIDIGGGIEERGNEILITGHGEFVQKDGKSIVMYHGKVKSKPGKTIAITGTASAVFAIDWVARRRGSAGRHPRQRRLVPNEGVAPRRRPLALRPSTANRAS